ncbi:MAG TPA: cytochrome c biogenesis protein CcsA [Polyangiaceae bacterium LLY-WYZ-15_(1-7)]|nr:heme transporter [Myxococcales bacterium]MAT23674.1 heme transporter [Sandaracinus sp.]HJK90999.1 cytochrome c biogenesis protein CcsA [Polyangiaceae bacterium LLY-WYZ-15_(1-7)]MBJ69763.1 heme transporter [Sandaracinus sp.]HJL02125.1 cytochrome c biogenesis protein CcsA [Polyangiaceae bacterium LLY-WYZ-15_(1-7)]
MATPDTIPRAVTPQVDTAPAGWVWHSLAALTVVLFGVTLYLIFMEAPVEEQMGIVQKIFYFHVPSAYCMYVGYTAAAVGGLLYLWKRSPRWDAISLAGAEIGVLFTAIVLVTGPLWGRKAWGVYWVWDPRLTSTLLTGMIYASFLALRGFGSTGEAEKRFAAALAIVGFPLLFLIKYSVKRWSGQHPVVISGGGGGIAEGMVPALIASFLAFTALVAWMLLARYRVERQRQELWSLELEAARRGLGGEA